jgi:hypothetical protein
MRKSAGIFSAFVLSLFLFPALAQGQIRLIPQAGLYASVSDLGTVNTTDGALDVGKNESSLALGLTLDLGSNNALGFRVTGLYGTKTDVPVGGVGCGGSACDLRSTLLGVSGSGVLRALSPSSPLRPYVLGGIGMKRYDFSFSSQSQIEDAFDDDSKIGVVLGVGFELNLLVLKGNVELVDMIGGSVVDGGDTQHDFFLTVGWILG